MYLDYRIINISDILNSTKFVMNMNNMYLEYRIINISDILNSTKFVLHAGYLQVLLFLKSHLPSPLQIIFPPLQDRRWEPTFFKGVFIRCIGRINCSLGKAYQKGWKTCHFMFNFLKI